MRNIRERLSVVLKQPMDFQSIVVELDGPHLGINDPRSTNRVNMLYDFNVNASMDVDAIIDKGVRVAESTPRRKLKNIVFRCHGLPGYLLCGTGISQRDVIKFGLNGVRLDLNSTPCYN